MTASVLRPLTRAITLAAAALLGTAPGSSLQLTAQSPPTIRGRVMSADADARPLPNARITVVGANDEPMFSGGDGTFTISSPPSSSLRVEKAGFAPAIVRVQPDSTGDLRIALARGAVITGVVVDELGFPANDVRVHVRSAEAGAAPGGSDYFAETDDTGAYRIGSLPAGRYLVNSEAPLPLVPDTGYPGVFGEMEARMREARLRAAAAAPALSAIASVDLRAGEEAPVLLTHGRRAVTPPDAPIAGAAAGSVVDEFGEPVEGIAVRLWRVRFAEGRNVAEPSVLVRRTDDRGQFRLAHVPPGRYLLAATDGQGAFAPVYFPGTTSPTNAVPFTVGRSQEVSAATITYTRTREGRVAGTALDPRGGTLRGSVTLVASQRSGAIALPARMTETDENGGFEFRNVPPGEYVVRATSPSHGSMRMQTLEAFGAQFVTVGGADAAPITIPTSAAATVSGRVVVEGERSAALPDGFFVTATPDPDGGPIGRWSFEARFTPEGVFEMRGLAGTYRLTALAPPGWWVKSIAVGGIDVLLEPIRFGGPDDSRNDVTVVVAPGAAAVNGRVTDDDGRAADDYRVVMFSTESRQWVGRTPFVRIGAGPETDGGFSIRDLPPGEYWAVAVDGIEGDADAGEWQNPDVLTRLATLATRVTLSQGGRANVNLTLRRWSR
jgi:hypothetical protein